MGKRIGFALALLWIFGSIGLAHAEDWEIIDSLKIGKKTASIMYDFASKEIRVSFKEKRLFHKTKYSNSYAIGTPNEVDQAIAELNPFLVNYGLPLEKVSTFLDKLDEFKFLNPKECSVLHLNLGTPEAVKSVNPLLKQLDEIHQQALVGPQAFRSVSLLDINVGNGGKVFQLRGVLDKSGKLIDFSIVKKNGNLKGYQVFKNGDDFVFKGPVGDVIFILKPSDLDSEDIRITLYKKNNRGIENINKEHYLLKNTNGNLSLNKYATNERKAQESEEGVLLTTIEAEHEPVVRLEKTDTYFPAATLMDFETFFSKLTMGSERDKDNLFSKATEVYNLCMSERYLLRMHEGGSDTDEEIRLSCLNMSSLETSLSSIRGNLSEELSDLIGNKDTFEEVSKKIETNFISCLLDKNFYKKTPYYREVNYEKLKGIKQKTLEKEVSNCLTLSQSDITASKLEYEIKNDENILSIVNNSTVLKLLSQDVLKRGYNNCLLEVGESKYKECLKYANLIKESSLTLANISQQLLETVSDNSELFRKVRLDVSSTLKSCEDKFLKGVFTEIKSSKVDWDSLTEKQMECFKNAAVKMEQEVGYDAVLKLLREIPHLRKSISKISPELKEKSIEEVKSCMSYKLSQETFGVELLVRLDEIRYQCHLDGAKKIIPELFGIMSEDVIQKYITDENLIEKIKKELARTLKRQIRDDITPDEIQKHLEDNLSFVYSHVVNSKIEEMLNSGFPLDGDDIAFNNEAAKSLRIKLNQLLHDNDGEPLKLNLLQHFQSFKEENLERAIQLYANKFIKDAAKEMSSYQLVRDIGRSVLKKSDLRNMVETIDKDFQACLDTYKENSDSPVFNALLKCEKRRAGDLIYLTSKREIEGLVSQSFALTSTEANNILNPIQYMKNCIDDINLDPKRSLREHEELSKACVALTRIDISSNLTSQRIKKFRPILGGSRSMDPSLISAYCYRILFVDFYKESTRLGINLPNSKYGKDSKSRSVDDIWAAANGNNKGAASMLSYLISADNLDRNYRYSDREALKGMLQTIAESEKIDLDFVLEKAARCEKQAEDFIEIGFREFVVKSIPRVWKQGEDPKEVEEIVRKFLDPELVKLIIKFQELKDESGRELETASTPINNRAITPEVGMTAMRNLILTLGEFIREGFVYDKKQMVTELVVFQEELKGFLDWYLRNPKVVTVGEARDFFQTSKLADHLGLAVVSKNVKNQFMIFLNKMETEEKNAFKAKIKCWSTSCMSSNEKADYRGITSKYTGLRNDARTMTKAYDFERIFEPQSPDGGKVLEYINENYLLPKMMGVTVSARVDDKIRTQIAKMILGDNTAGGFAEKFVARIAQQELDKEKRDRWGITKFLFFDDGDFDWNKLRNTTSGQKAIAYYGKYLLLPKILGEKVTKYQEKLFMKRFRDLLNDAQGEHDD